MTTAPATPLAVPRSARRVILFGGTFDPPHRAHVELPLAARALIEGRDAASGGGADAAAWLVFVPAARSPHKQEGPQAGDEDRIEMLRIALGEAGVREGEPDRVAIWSDEIDRANWAARHGSAGRPSYMVETVRRVPAALGGGGDAAEGTPRVGLLLGADQAIAFHRWTEAETLLRLADVYVMPRDGIETGADLVERLRPLGVWSEKDLAAWERAVLGLPVIDVAATPVRRLLREPAEDEGELEMALGRGVLRYIRERGLYGAAGS